MVGGSKSHTPFDSRLLLSLVKCEKEVADSFKSYTQTCENANNALNGWAAADTGDSRESVLSLSIACLHSANRGKQCVETHSFTHLLMMMDDVTLQPTYSLLATEYANYSTTLSTLSGPILWHSTTIDLH